jgi:hypothetical protein
VVLSRVQAHACGGSGGSGGVGEGVLLTGAQMHACVCAHVCVEEFMYVCTFLCVAVEGRERGEGLLRGMQK